MSDKRDFDLHVVDLFVFFFLMKWKLFSMSANVNTRKLQQSKAATNQSSFKTHLVHADVVHAYFKTSRFRSRFFCSLFLSVCFESLISRVFYSFIVDTCVEQRHITFSSAMAVVSQSNEFFRCLLCS